MKSKSDFFFQQYRYIVFKIKKISSLVSATFWTGRMKDYKISLESTKIFLFSKFNAFCDSFNT